MSTFKRYWLWSVIVLVGMTALLLAPGGFVTNSRLLLHGLCAQTPGHTFTFGGHLLPFDARMTGIYSGAGVTLLYLAMRGRWLCEDKPALPYLLALLVLLASMALDGTNSFLTDIGAWHPWQTTNTSRLVTGYGAGMAIAVVLVWLVAGTVWQLAEPAPAIRSWGDLMVPLAGLPFIGLVLWWAPAWLYVPVALFLALSAWLVVSIIVLTAVLLVTRKDDAIVARPQMHIPGALAALLGLMVIILLASGRRWLETSLGIPSNL
ncbi:MAG: DUF2085 domain-containing protein [Thermomicrobiales bacterium]|nr:DUF2085 domain-containing protein [Thermomicrobiales bacterium]